MVIQGGTATFQIPHWVTGTANTATTWSLIPSTGAGTITGDGFYTPPTVVTTPQSAIIQAVSAANSAVTMRIYFTLIPNGGIRIDSGSLTGSQDAEGLAWLPAMGFEAGSFATVTDNPSAWGTLVDAQPLSSYMYTDGGDIVYKLHVPNGNYQVSLSFGVGNCEGQYSAQIPSQNAVWGALNLQSQSALAYQNWNFSTPIASACRKPETATLAAQVTNGILTFGVRASTLNGQDSAALLNAVSILPVNQAGSNSIQTVSTTTAAGSATYTLQQFDPGCGQPGYNCQNAFQLALATLAQAGGGTLQLPAGTFTVNFPGVVQNVLPGVPLARKSLLVVPSNTIIRGHLAADGTPDSIIEWSISSIPVFIFDRSSHSGLQNLHLRFTGFTPQAYPFGDIALLTALGYNPTFPHYNQMSGSNGEMFSFAYVFDSDYCTFDHLLFNSATQDNDHILGMAINVKGKGVVNINGGGLTQLAESNRITNIQVYDFMNAFLVTGQDNFVMQNITADRRGSRPETAPGHVLYTDGIIRWDMAGNIVNALLSTNTTIQNITEGPDTYSNVVAGGTLAIKFLNGAQISNVTSQHPEGLIQTIYVDQNVTFSNLSWTSNYPLCTKVPLNCSTPAIYSTASAANFPPTKNLTFQNISLISTASPTTVTLIGDNLQVNGLSITTSPLFLPGQIPTNAVLDVKLTGRATISGYSYTPLLSSFDPKQKYNRPFTGWDPTTNVTAAITLNWPKAIPLPVGNPVITSVFQSSGAAYNNLETTTIKLQ
jgi:hypothetical protein